MAQGFTLEQLQQKGAVPVKKTGGLTFQQLQAQQVVKPKETVMQKTSRLLDMFFGGGKVGEAIGTEIARSRATPEQKPFIGEGPSQGQVFGSTLQSASLFAPVGRVASGITAGARALGMKTGVSALGKIGSGLVTGGAFDVATNLQEGKTGASALTPGFGAAIGGAIPGLGVAKNVTVRFGEQQAPRIINSLIKPLAKDFSYGKNPGRAVAEEGIIANNFDDLVSKIRSTRQRIGQAIGDLGSKLSTKPQLNIRDSLLPINDAMKEAASMNNPTLLNRLVNVKEAISNVLEPGVDETGNIIIKKVGDRKLEGLTFQEVRDILGDIGDMTQFTGNPSDDKLVNSALKQVYGSIKQKSLEGARNVNPELASEFEKLTEKYADLSSAEIATKYRDKIVERSNLVGFSPTVAGIGTALVTAIATGGATIPVALAGLSGAVIDKLASTPGFKTRLAALLSKKTTEEASSIFQKIPALRRIFPKGSAISPGDRLLDTEAGKKFEKGVIDYAKNPKLGMSIEDVSKQGDNLLSEARKYKSAEEFVKAQGTPVYHGTSVENLTNLEKGVKILSPEEKLKLASTGGGNVGISMTTDKTTAFNYSQAFGNKKVGEFYLNPKAKIKEISTYIDDTFTPEQIEKLRKQGYDAIRSTAEEKEVRILSENAVRTKSQLENIWKQQNPEIFRLQNRLDDLDQAISDAKDRGLDYGDLEEQWQEAKSQLTDIWNKANQATSGISSLGKKIIDNGEVKPTIKLKRDVTVTTLSGEKVTIPEDEVLKAYESGGKALLKDGREYIVSKSQYENIKNNSLKSEAKEFAPELKGTEEVVKGGAIKESPRDKAKRTLDEAGYTFEEGMPGTEGSLMKNGEYVEVAFDELPKDIQKALNTYIGGAETVRDIKPVATKYSQYQLPGGKNYREIIIKAPVEEGKPIFTSSHYPDEKNPISHLRVKEYDTKKYGQVTFMEELQSDWAREARAKGTGLKAISDGENGYKVVDSEGKTIKTNLSKQSAEIMERDSTPSNPILKNWQELSIKRALKEAVDNNSDYLAWTTGEQQAARYNLATHLKEVNWKSGKDGRVVTLKPKDGGTISLWMDENGKIVEAGGTGTMRGTMSEAKGKKLDEVIGKGLAEKIMSEKTGQLSGEGLAFGGEWAKNLYDRQVKNIVEDITGHKVEVIDMGLAVDAKKYNFYNLSDSGARPIKVSDLKVGKEIRQSIGTNGQDYIITDILGDGKFKAVPKEHLLSWDTIKKVNNGRNNTNENWNKYTKVGDNWYRKTFAETFDISTKKSAGQQAIRITPEIKALVKGVAPKLK